MVDDWLEAAYEDRYAYEDELGDMEQYEIDCLREEEAMYRAEAEADYWDEE